MKKTCLAVLLTIILICTCFTFAFAAYTKDDIPKPSNDEFEPFEGEQDNLHCVLLGIRFDLDDENMPVVIMKFSVENVGERSTSLAVCFWIETTDSYKTGSGSYLSGISKKHYDNYERLDMQTYSELKPGEKVEFEEAFKLDNFTDPIYINDIWGDFTERRQYNPQDINNYKTVFSNRK